MKILIILSSGIGDTVMLTPSIRALRRHYPDAVIDLLATHPMTGDVFLTNRIVNTILNVDWQKKSFRSKLALLYSLRKRHYNVSLIPTSITPTKASVLSFLIGAEIRLGEYWSKRQLFYTHQKKVNPNRHKIHSNLDLLTLLGVDIADSGLPFCEYGHDDEVFAEKYLSDIGASEKVLFAFHPGGSAGQHYKIWPKDHFIQLGEKILETYDRAHLIFVGGPSERHLPQEIVDTLKRRASVATSQTLKQTVALINRCQFFISSDTGIAHAAATTKTRTIVLFGPSFPSRTAPVGMRVSVIEAPCNNRCNEVLTPHYDTAKLHTHKCLDQITPERVLDEIQKTMESQ